VNVALAPDCGMARDGEVTDAGHSEGLVEGTARRRISYKKLA
jgi:hypothetical protein